MDIASEKAGIMERFNQVNDESLILAIKNLLDFGLSRQGATEYDPMLEAALQEALEQSDRRQVTPHADFWGEVRKRYPAA